MLTTGRADERTGRPSEALRPHSLPGVSPPECAATPPPPPAPPVGAVAPQRPPSAPCRCPAPSPWRCGLPSLKGSGSGSARASPWAPGRGGAGGRHSPLCSRRYSAFSRIHSSAFTRASASFRMYWGAQRDRRARSPWRWASPEEGAGTPFHGPPHPLGSSQAPGAQKRGHRRAGQGTVLGAHRSVLCPQDRAASLLQGLHTAGVRGPHARRAPPRPSRARLGGRRALTLSISRSSMPLRSSSPSPEASSRGKHSGQRAHGAPPAPVLPGAQTLLPHHQRGWRCSCVCVCVCVHRGDLRPRRRGSRVCPPVAPPHPGVLCEQPPGQDPICTAQKRGCPPACCPPKPGVLC